MFTPGVCFFFFTHLLHFQGLLVHAGYLYVAGPRKILFLSESQDLCSPCLIMCVLGHCPHQSPVWMRDMDYVQKTPKTVGTIPHALLEINSGHTLAGPNY